MKSENSAANRYEHRHAIRETASFVFESGLLVRRHENHEPGHINPDGKRCMDRRPPGKRVKNRLSTRKAKAF